MLENTASGQLVAQYGYLAVLAGTMLEGETVVLVAGFLAHQGHLSLWLIILCAIIGSSTSDQGLFFLSRFKGKKLLARFPKVAERVNALSEKMRTRPVALTAFALLFRFFYGLRNIAPVFLGMSSIPTMRFVLLNALGAVLWATLFSWGGFLFARILSAMLGTLARYEVGIVLVLISTGLCWGGYRRWKQMRSDEEGRKTPPQSNTGV